MDTYKKIRNDSFPLKQEGHENLMDMFCHHKNQLKYFCSQVEMH